MVVDHGRGIDGLRQAAAKSKLIQIGGDPVEEVVVFLLPPTLEKYCRLTDVHAGESMAFVLQPRRGIDGLCPAAAPGNRWPLSCSRAGASMAFVLLPSRGIGGLCPVTVTRQPVA